MSIQALIGPLCVRLGTETEDTTISVEPSEIRKDGGVVFSNGTADSDGTTLTQVFSWNTFVGGNPFCFKACFNSITSPDYCENRYDPVGCDYNMPSTVQNSTFTECDGDLQDVVGTYTSNDQSASHLSFSSLPIQLIIALTWSMPDPFTTSPPYTPCIPASSNCKTFQSSHLFLAAPTSSSNSASTTGTGSKATGTSGSSGSSVSAGSSVGASGASPTGATFGAMSLHASIGVWVLLPYCFE
ncbi:hypothetical protein M422DRAFT_269930 [Sphaerobolus stellatus SS14]|uniref:Uncharacterized protein n=1 Tax=Sphaerobolus stellatus (strain SS14) TaxID=990650 RepID=A0A0C9UIG4_SPHS4|nr:hypothetical protein M422DRAFT_269930 [Sphaerobolus stellatus SS14]